MLAIFRLRQAGKAAANAAISPAFQRSSRNDQSTNERGEVSVIDAFTTSKVLTNLNISNNNITNEGVSVIVKAIEGGKLPDLLLVDVSDNPATNKGELLEALKDFGEKAEAASPSDGSSSPRGGPRRYALAPGFEFRIMTVNAMRSVEKASELHADDA